MILAKVDIHMKGISVFLYSIRQGLKNLRYNSLFTLASIGTIAACLFLFGIFYFIVGNFQYMVKSAESSVGFSVFFVDGISEEDIEKIGDKIRECPDVSDVVYVSAEEAWENFKSEVFEGKTEEIADTFGEDNPLENSASYEVYLSDISKQKEIVNYIRSFEGVRRIKSSDTAAVGMTNFNKLIGYVSATIIIILLAVSVFLINTTITMGVSVRKEEISIMRLVGATDLFIKLPFILEGVFIGFVGAAIPLLLLYSMYDRIVVLISERFNVLSEILVFMDSKTVFSVLIPVSLILGIGIGYIGSALTLRKHMKV